MWSIVGSQLLAALVQVLSLRLYTELLAPHEFGRVVLALATLAVLEGLVTATLSQVIAKEAPTWDAGARLRNAEKLWKKVRDLVTLVGATAVLLSAIASAALPGWILWAIYAGCTWLYLLADTWKTAATTLLNVEQQHSHLATCVAAESILLVSVVAAAMLAFGGSSTTYLIAYLLGRAGISLLVGTWARRRIAKTDTRALDSVPDMRRALSYAIPFIPMSVLGWVGSYADRFVAGLQGGAATVGIYGAASGLVSRPMNIAASALSTYFRPKLFSADESSAQIQMRWIVCALITGLFATCAAVLLGELACEWILAPSYRAAAPALVNVLVVSASLTLVSHALDNRVLSTGRSAQLLKPQILSTLGGLGAIFFLVDAFGAVGIAYGKLVAESLRVLCTAALVISLESQPKR